MKNIVTIMMLIVLAVAFNACHQSKESKEIAEEKNKEKFENLADEKDAQFVLETVNALHTLIALTDVAVEKDSKSAAATAKKVKPELQTLLGEVESYATAHVISIPEEATENATKKVRKLLDEKPSEFDSRWSKEIRDKNKDLIREMEAYGSITKDMNIKTWLNSALPHARTIQDNLVDFDNQISKN
jgi:putative membrane protein